MARMDPQRQSAIAGMAQALASLRARARWLLIGQGTATLVAWVLGVCILAGAVDFVLRTPWWLRTVLWIVGIGAVAWGVRRLVAPALRFRPTLTEVALRVERSQPGRSAGLSGLLAAGLELADGVDRGEIRTTGQDLADPVIRQAAERFGRVRASALLTGSGVGRSSGAVAVMLLSLVAIGVSFPSLVSIGAWRVLAPWSDVSWPKRTQVVDATGETVHPIGTAIALRAAVLRGARVDHVEGGTRVWGMYRIVRSDGLKPGDETGVSRVLLTNQGKQIDVPGDEGSSRGVLFERLIEPTLPAASTRRGEQTPGGAREAELEYWFETADDRTPTRRMTLVDPPAVVEASVRIEAPAYAALAEHEMNRTLTLGPGNDERAAPPAMLVGSELSLTIMLNTPVPGPEADKSVWLGRSLGNDLAGLIESGAATAVFDGSVWTIDWTLRESARVAVRPTDKYGVIGVEESVYRFDALVDQPPTAVVTQPAADESVLASATIEVVGEARDDVGVSEVALERRTADKPKGSAGAPAEPREDWVRMAAEQDAPGRTTHEQPKQVTVASTFDLAPMKLSPGDEVWLATVATDAYDLDGQRHAPTRSAVRRLTVISEEEFVARLWNDLEGVRRSALRIDEEQERALKLASRGGQESGQIEDARAAQKTQAAITERIARERDAVNRLSERMDRNGLHDREMTDLLTKAESLLEQAGTRSVDASREIESISRAKAESGKASEESLDVAARSQRQVRDSLEQLAGMLDRGKDTWATKRAIERLLQDQIDLKDKTGQVSQETAGRSMEELTDEQRRSLQRLGDEQRSLAGKAAEAVERMLRDKDEVAQRDAAAAKAMEQAAQKAQRDRLEEKMQDAANQVENNRGSNAQQQQQQAIDSLQQMLDQMNSAAQNRDQELRRVLATLIESIEALITEQTAQLGVLAQGLADSDFDPAAAGMVRLNRNTIGVIEEAENGPAELAPVVELLARADEAQGAAIRTLRGSPVDSTAAEQSEKLSLQRLQQARDEAKRLDEQAEDREQERRAAELRNAYRQALTEQVAIKGETDPLIDAEPTRRTRAAARALAERQQTLKNSLTELQDKTRELSEATLFEFAHQRLDEAMGSAATTLRAGDADTGVQRRQATAVRTLQALVEALDRSRRQNDDFRDNPNAGGGGGGQGGKRPLVPPIAQLRLLRSMQVEAGELTRLAADSGETEVTAEATRLQQELAERGDVLLKKLMEQGDGGQPEPEEEKPQGSGAAWGPNESTTPEGTR
ncbi:MAG: hypothetical protein KF745_12050 [Phycisphaeraceae bacterium]|nr:hypothetical protein [Phycisphaeraceae bacterium]